MMTALLAVTTPSMPRFDALNAQMTNDYNAARATMLSALTPAHRQLLGSIAAALTTSTHPDFAGAVKQLDQTLSPVEKQAILAAYDSEHEKLRVIMRKASVISYSLHDTGVVHIGALPRGRETAGALLLYEAMHLGPMTMNAMIVTGSP